MKNAEKDWLKKCIALSQEDFEDVLSQVFKTKINTDFTIDGISIYPEDDDADWDESAVPKALSEYFGVEVTSIHIEACELFYTSLVWIAYKEE